MHVKKAEEVTVTHPVHKVSSIETRRCGHQTLRRGHKEQGQASLRKSGITALIKIKSPSFLSLPCRGTLRTRLQTYLCCACDVVEGKPDLISGDHLFMVFVHGESGGIGANGIGAT